MKKYIIALLVFLFVGCRAPSIYTHGIPNLIQVGPGIWRGGQPTDEGWRWLVAVGVTNDIKLNVWSGYGDNGARDVGMTIHYYPINAVQQLTVGPGSNQVWQAVSHIRPGTFLHCTHGQDRTGLVVYSYRIRNGWSKADAWKEMQDLGFHNSLFGLWLFCKTYE